MEECCAHSIQYKKPRLKSKPNIVVRRRGLKTISMACYNILRELRYLEILKIKINALSL